MVLYPDIQKKAQQELDSVIGRGRLPEFTDRPSLPYIDSIVKETIRWNPVAPLGSSVTNASIRPIANALTQDCLTW
jgi:cytochrome P450